VRSAENLAMHYEVPLWSEKHCELMARSMRLMFEIGSRCVDIDLVIDFDGYPSNTQSLVRWIRQPDGSFKHDFSLLEKYLDLVEKTIGKPRPLRLNCWGEFSEKKKKWWRGTPRFVSVLDPKTGKLERYEQPLLGTPEWIKLWKPVLEGIRERAKKRGWEDVLALGHVSYCTPPCREAVDAANLMLPGVPWSFTSHNCTLHMIFKGNKSRAPVLYGSCVWTQGRPAHRGYRRLLARIDKPDVWTTGVRNWLYDGSDIFGLRKMPEGAIMRGHNGAGHGLGGDLFPIRGKSRGKGKGRGRSWHHRYGRGGLGPEWATRCILASGKDGAIPTERYEMFREGMQLCETILRLQQQLDAKKIPGDLAKRVNACLDRRSTAFLKGYWEGQLERDRELLEIAGEVAGVAGPARP
jgi:hypothetical protein